MGVRYSEARVKEILRRQDPPKFGSAYEPSIRASRDEAPSKSRPELVWSELLQRYVSTLAHSEKSVLAITLYHPKLFELHEQRMLPYLPATHPLVGHPYAVGMTLPSFRGTLSISEQLGGLKYHPTFKVSNKEIGNQTEFPAPWIGDLLAFVMDDIGPYCINLNVKSTRLGFTSPQIGVTVKTDMNRAIDKENIRQNVERILYEEVSIPTVCIAADELDPIAIANLQQLLLWQKRPNPFNEEIHSAIVAAFNRGMCEGLSAWHVVQVQAKKYRCSQYDVKIALYKAIFHRQIRIDLFQYFFIDHPMVPEKKDLLEVYGHWFRRG